MTRYSVSHLSRHSALLPGATAYSDHAFTTTVTTTDFSKRAGGRGSQEQEVTFSRGSHLSFSSQFWCRCLPDQAQGGATGLASVLSVFPPRPEPASHICLWQPLALAFSHRPRLD